MADGVQDDEDLFADLYDGDDNAAESAHKTEPEPELQLGTPPQDFGGDEPTIAAGDGGATEVKTEHQEEPQHNEYGGSGGMNGVQNLYRDTPADEKPIGIKEDGKMFIGGLNWETTDESLKQYFSQFGEVVECTVMRDGATGRSRGFGFLTFKDPKNVNTVMVKEHSLDGKLIDPKRAIPRDEQERTAKIFVGGVSQEATEPDFKEFFEQFGRVLDATLMMDKDTGRPRGFGFVTFDSEVAVERTLEGPLAILGKPIEVKRAQPRGKMGEEEAPKSKWQPRGQFNNGGGGGFNNQNQMGGGDANGNGAGNQNPNNMTPAMMAQYWQRMQQYFAMMQAQNMGGGMGGGMGGMGGMNPMMQQMMMQRAQQGGQMNPQMMQQMAAMQQQGFQGGMQGGGGDNSPMHGGQGGQGGNGRSNSQGGFSAQEQLMFEQQKYERQQMARMQQGNFGGENTWDGMYDDVPAPQGMSPGPGGRGGFNPRGRGGFQNRTPQPAGQAPAGAPTGPKNAGKPGANYRGGGRGGHRGFHPYARGGG